MINFPFIWRNSRRIVLVTLRGGLGNQMFQYAIGRSISEKHDRALVLDDLALRVDHPGRTKRSYALGVFNIDAKLTSEISIRRAANRAVIVQDRRGFHEHVLQPNLSVHLELHGFWQHERYFADIAHLLRDHFCMKPGPWDSSAWKPRIAAVPSAVCVHVRRQDYLTVSTFGFVGREYYQRAAMTMADHVADAHFFIFSDDIPWCKANLSLDQPHSFVEHNGRADDSTYTDLSLMTLCRHFIIANSSFSWWAAWLGADPRKIVMAPKDWFRDIPSDSRDITPESWLRL
jgi:glycosyl transferase family 11